MDEKLFESKIIGGFIEVFKDRIVITNKIFGLNLPSLGGKEIIPMSQIASIETPFGKPLQIETTGGKKFKIAVRGSFLSRKRDTEFMEIVMKAKSQN
jgi:hypothetical protein